MGQRRKKIAENFNPLSLSSVYKPCRQTDDRQTERR